MAMVQGNARRNQIGTLVAGAAGQAAYNQLLQEFRQLGQIGSYGSKKIKQALQGQSGSSRGRRNRSRKSGNGSAVRGGTSRFMPASIPGGLSGAQTMRTSTTDLIALPNPNAGILNNGYNLGFQTSAASMNGLFGTGNMPRAAQLSGLYREFRVNTLEIWFIPFVSTTTSGCISFGVDPDPSAGIPSTLNDPARHKTSAITDLAEKCRIVYNPRQDGKITNRYVNGATGRTDDELNFGVLQVYSNNSLAAGAPIGYLKVTLDVTFIGPR